LSEERVLVPRKALEELLRKVEELEKALADLERRVEKLAA